MVRQRHVGRACQDRTSAGRTPSRSKFIASSHRRWQLLSRNSRAGQVTPFVSTPSLGIRFSSEYPHSGLEPLGRTILSPSERNATAKQGSEGPPPIACSLTPCACTLTHAFANSPTPTRRTSLKHGCWILARYRESCRWPTPQRNAEKITASCIREMSALWSSYRKWRLIRSD
jgi:hypothetical protein